MKTKNRLAEFIKHAVDEEAYGNSLMLEIKDKFKDLYKRIINEIKKYPYISSKEKYQILYDKIDEYITTYNTEFDDWLDEKVEEIVDIESDWLIDFMAAAGITYIVNKNILSKVKFMPVAGNNSYLDTGTQAVSKMESNVNTTLKNAYLTKESTETIAQRLEDRYQKYEDYLDSEISTFNTAIFRNTDNQLYRMNNQKVRYSAILDSRTCLSCGEYHGLLFNITEAPNVPLHYGCRCTLIPEELFTDEDVTSFSDWIEELSDDEKKEYLGKGRYELYKAGIPVTSFVDNGRVLTLDELNNRGSE